MKLGIAVVYLLEDGNDERLIELHLSQIGKNTPEPYTIYAAVNRLPAQARLSLERHPKVKICNLPTTELRGSREASFYLERLVKAAIQDGATHVCTLHVDSFPIQPGWATTLAAKLHGDCVLAGMVRDRVHDHKPTTAFMLFAREFYLTYDPRFRVSEETHGTPEYRRYSEAFRHIADSGCGYGFRIFSEGLTWHPLVRTDGGPAGWGFGIFGDMVFHLGGFSYYARQKGSANRPWQTRLAVFLRRWEQYALVVLPWTLRVRIGKLAPRLLRGEIGTLRMKERTAALVADPEAFLLQLKTGRRRPTTGLRAADRFPQG